MDTATAEPAQIAAQQPLNAAPALPKRNQTTFNSSSARQAALRSHEVRRIRAAQDQAAKSIAAKVWTQAAVEPADSYVFRRLAKVREQIDTTNTLIGKCRNPLLLDKLCSALAKLSEQERILSGRPLPGSMRPKAAKPSSQSRTADALELPDHMVEQLMSQPNTAPEPEQP
jgi:hypothetical protein